MEHVVKVTDIPLSAMEMYNRHISLIAETAPIDQTHHEILAGPAVLRRKKHFYPVRKSFFYSFAISPPDGITDK